MTTKMLVRLLIATLVAAALHATYVVVTKNAPPADETPAGFLLH